MLYFLLLLPVLFIVGIVRYVKHRSGHRASQKSKVVKPSGTENKELLSDCDIVNRENENISDSPIKDTAPVESKTLKEEEPYAAVVMPAYLHITCSKCFAWNIYGEKERVPLTSCNGCNVVFYCSSKCQKADWNDHKEECILLRSRHRVCMLNATLRMICRILMKSKSQPDWKAFNGRTYDSLMDHCEERRKEEDMMEAAKSTFDQLERCMGAKAPDFESFFLAFSKLSTNAFGIVDGSSLSETRGEGLYIGLSVMNHSCRPDAFVIFQGANIVLRTTNMEKIYSDQLTVRYLGNFMNITENRRFRLQKGYYFTCMCEECMDVEQDGMRTSGRPKCCPNGWFSLSHLRCSICNKDVDPGLGKLTQTINEQLKRVVVIQGKLDTVTLRDELTELFELCSKVLSDENTILMGFAELLCRYSDDKKICLRYADACLQMKRKLAFDNERSDFFCYRYMLLKNLKESFNDEMEALEEALESIKIAFGPDHELTLEFMKRQRIYKNLALLRNA